VSLFEHHRCRRRLDRWVDGALDDDLAARVSAHVRRCAACTRIVELTRHLRHSLARGAAPDPHAVARLTSWARAGFDRVGDDGT
jgi:anti-sigma factor RsiW